MVDDVQLLQADDVRKADVFIIDAGKFVWMRGFIHRARDVVVVVSSFVYRE
jgi:hypothetical protein